MTAFFDRLQRETASERDYLFSAPIISRCFAGDVQIEDYGGFLTQAFHHVRHTVPLMMAAGARLRPHQDWMRGAIAEYIAEEIGHEEWILDDLACTGYQRQRIRNSQPAFATEVMVAYAYDTIARHGAVGFFGMVHVLEGTSVSTADAAADAIQTALGLPDEAFHYLRSHGAIDTEHVAFFEDLMNRIDNASDQELVLHSARMFYRLYGNIFHTLAPLPLAHEEIRGK